jgi:hypothetical protein
MTGLGSQPGAVQSQPGTFAPGALGSSAVTPNPLAGTALYVYAPRRGVATHNSEAPTLVWATFGDALLGNAVFGLPLPDRGTAVRV